MTHKAIFRQHWTQAFTEADFCTRLHNAATAAQWSRARWAEELLPRTRRLDCRTVIDAAAEQTDIPEPDDNPHRRRSLRWRRRLLRNKSHL